jgi:hypothetical protein
LSWHRNLLFPSEQECAISCPFELVIFKSVILNQIAENKLFENYIFKKLRFENINALLMWLSFFYVCFTKPIKLNYLLRNDCFFFPCYSILSLFKIIIEFMTFTCWTFKSFHKFNSNFKKWRKKKDLEKDIYITYFGVVWQQTTHSSHLFSRF